MINRRMKKFSPSSYVIEELLVESDVTSYDVVRDLTEEWQEVGIDDARITVTTGA